MIYVVGNCNHIIILIDRDSYYFLSDDVYTYILKYLIGSLVY